MVRFWCYTLVIRRRGHAVACRWSRRLKRRGSGSTRAIGDANLTVLHLLRCTDVELKEKFMQEMERDPLFKVSHSIRKKRTQSAGEADGVCWSCSSPTFMILPRMRFESAQCPSSLQYVSCMI